MGVNDGSHQLVFDKQLMFAVRFALEARLPLHGVICTVTGRSCLLQWFEVFHKDERFEYRPVVPKNDSLNRQQLLWKQINEEVRPSCFTSQGLELLWNSEPLAERDPWVSLTPCFLLSWTCPPCWCHCLYLSGCPSWPQQWCDLR